MSSIKPLFCFLLVLATGSAGGQTPLGAERAQRLLTRAGFAPSISEIDRFASLTHAQAVDQLLATTGQRAISEPPGWVEDPVIGPREFRALPEDKQKLERQKNVRQSLELRAWWITEMVNTPSPLTERMTLFWHNHFVSAQPKVRWPQLMYRQNVLLRQHALGDFDELLHAIARDPAMLVYLDAASNRRANPNENFAREVMELFVLGTGHYNESDIREAARAFAGWSLDPDTLTYVYRPAFRDNGTKTVLGTSGALDGDQVLDILLAQPAAAEFVVSKLWLEFVSPHSDRQRIKTIAARFRESRYRIAVAMRELLLQPELIERSERDALVKSPVDLLVGLTRQTGASLGNATGAAIATATMGQNLFSAPNVRGWPGGEAWINTQTLLARKQFIDRALMSPAAASQAMRAALTGADESMGVIAKAGSAATPNRRRLEAAQLAAIRVDSTTVLKSAGGLLPERPVTSQDIDMLADRLLVLAPVSPPSAGTLGLDALRALLLDPAYQLK